MRATWIAAGGLALALIAAAAGAYYFFARAANGDLPAAGSPAYEQTTSSFYRGLAQLQVGLLDDAKREFSKAAALAPGEPAAWANLGLAHLRLGEFDAATEPVAKAVALSPGSSELALLQGRLETSRGQLEPGIAHLRRAVDLDRADLRARYALAEEIERAGGSGADAEAQQQFEQILQRRPDNLAALLERARLSAKRGDAAALRDSTLRLDGMAAGWPAPAQEQFRALRQAVEAGNSADAARSVAFLRNVLVRSTVFRESLAQVRTPTELIAEPFGRFLRLSPPSPNPSPADQALTFTRAPLPGAGTAASVAFAVSLDGAAAPIPVAADNREIRVGAQPARGLPWPGTGAGPAPAANSILAIDWNRDFRMDLAVAGRSGVRLYLQRDGGRFEDATPKGGGIDAECLGVWAADIEMDGDLDLIVGVRGAAPVVLRNNGDGTWRQQRPFRSVAGVRAFVWADLDGDGVPDAAMVGESGDLHVFENRQGGEFREMSLAGLSGVVALSVGDVNGDGALDLVALDRSGVIRRLSFGAAGLEQQTLANWTDRIDSAGPATYAIFLADLDNNGAVDMVVSGDGRSRVWLGDEKNTLRPFAAADAPLRDVNVFGVIDLNGDGQLDLVGTSGGQPVVLAGNGTKGYHWAVMRPRAQPTAGDQRINSFGVGGEIEIRSGLLTQKQVLAGAPAHFGLGARTAIDVARIVWPNGMMQAEFDRAADQAVVAEQRLKGSCPWVFAYDGTGMRFVTDFLWRSPLGLRINAQDTAGVTQTEDWVRFAATSSSRGTGRTTCASPPSCGRRTSSITSRCSWSTTPPIRTSSWTSASPGKPPALAVQRDEEAASDCACVGRCRDATSRTWWRAQDGRYLATFARGPYQGVARDHFVEFEVDWRGPSGPQGPWLLANGFIYPTDSSINVAIGQAGIEPHGLSLEAQEPSGRWIVVAPDLGFPAGKNKTILIDLARGPRGCCAPSGSGCARTWRSTGIRCPLPRAPAARRTEPGYSRRAPSCVIVGFRRRRTSKRDVPETPHYDQLANVGPRWRDLVGYYTRYGEVGELLGRSTTGT